MSPNHLTLRKQIRFVDVARAFGILASNPEKILDLAANVDDETISSLEVSLHVLVENMDDDRTAEEIRTLISDPFTTTPPVILTAAEAADEGGQDFGWTKKADGMNRTFDCSWQGIKLQIQKRGPADYEGLIDGAHFARAKFKKNLRERLEREAAKRQAAV